MTIEQQLARLTDAELRRQVWISQTLLALVAVVVGSFTLTKEQWFSLMKFSWLMAVEGIALAVLIVFGQWLLQLKWPDAFHSGEAMERIFRHASLIYGLFLCVMVGFVEELLFRAVLQEQFGLFVATIIFTVVHLQYYKKWRLLILLVVVSASLGLLYEYTGHFWSVVICHALIDMSFVMETKWKLKKKCVDFSEE